MIIATKANHFNFSFLDWSFLNILRNIWYNAMKQIVAICRSLWTITTPPNKWRICIVNLKLQWFRTWTLWRFVACQFFWITSIVTCQTNRHIEKTLHVLIEYGMPMKDRYLLSISLCFTTINTRYLF